MGRNSQMPPVPPAAKGRHGDDEKTPQDTSKEKEPPENLDQQGRHGNIRQNTHHQGYQQDR
jgi:hypothetical protein